MLTVITPATTTALTTLAAVKADLAESGVADDGWLEDAIRRASATVCRFCNRAFALETVRETIRLPTPTDALTLARWPLVSIVSITEAGKPLAGTGYEAERDAGTVYRLTGSDTRRPWPAGKIVVEYQAGYALPGDPVRTLPEDIERAVILLVRHQWHARGCDPLVKAEEVDGVGRVEYWFGGGTKGSALPVEVDALLTPYRQPVMG